MDHFDADRSEVKAGGEGGFWGRRQSAPRPLSLRWRTEAAETRRGERRAESRGQHHSDGQVKGQGEEARRARTVTQGTGQNCFLLF